jgi:hypothetical protein
VILRLSGKAFLILAALLVSAAKLHAQHHALTPMAATQELNRCLTVVRAAASRRGSAAQCPRQIRRTDNVSDPRPGLAFLS